MTLRVTQEDKKLDRQNKQTLRALRRNDPKSYNQMMREIKGELRDDREKRRGNVVAATIKGGATVALAATGAAVANAGFVGAAKATSELAMLGYTTYGSASLNTLFGAGVATITTVLSGIGAAFGIENIRQAESNNRDIRAIQVANAKKRGLVPGM